MALILWICLMSCIGLSNALFVTKGRFEACPLGVNDDECGRRYTTKIINLQFKEHCYLCNYGNKTVFIAEATPTPVYPPKDELRVAFGVIADDDEAPWAVWIVFYSGFIKDRLCSGSLITFYWVLTAAHCLENADHSLTHAVVYAGKNRKGYGTSQLSYPDKWVIYHDYRPPDHEDQNDIGLMRLYVPFSRTYKDRRYSINTVCLPDFGLGFNADRDIAAFFGFGRIEGNIETEWLRKGVFSLNPYTECDVRGTLCANLTGRPGTPARTCYGDSGGGLVQYDEHWTRGIVAGVQSGTYNRAPGVCGPSIFYNFWSPVVPALHFILDTLACVHS